MSNITQAFHACMPTRAKRFLAGVAFDEAFEEAPTFIKCGLDKAFCVGGLYGCLSGRAVIAIHL